MLSASRKARKDSDASEPLSSASAVEGVIGDAADMSSTDGRIRPTASELAERTEREQQQRGKGKNRPLQPKKGGSKQQQAAADRRSGQTRKGRAKRSERQREKRMREDAMGCAVSCCCLLSPAVLTLRAAALFFAASLRRDQDSAARRSSSTPPTALQSPLTRHTFSTCVCACVH